jgi:hypothetical protein
MASDVASSELLLAANGLSGEALNPLAVIALVIAS